MYTPTIDTDIPFADYPVKFSDLKGRVDAAIASLAELDVQVEVSDADAAKARVLFTSDKRPTDEELADPETVVHLKALLTAYDMAVVKSAVQLRNFVTNKLLRETDNSSASIRIRALELLGKISDVGLFTDKTEITLRHRPTAELEQMLREKLERVVEGSAETIPPHPVAEREIRLDINTLDA